MTWPRVTTRAFAKINLDLRISGTRPGGYHELRTIFQSIALHDTITCTARPGPFTIRCREATVPHDRTNLVWRAASALSRMLQRGGSDNDVRDVSVTIRKRIPLRAGMGGGSADAAATILALVRLWRPAVSLSDLQHMARGVGADVPFLLTGGTALGLGRGDEIYPLADVPRWSVVVLVPDFGISTPDAYALYDEMQHELGAADVTSQRPPDAWSRAPVSLVNDLEAPVGRQFPEIAVMKAALRAEGATHAAMTGSGSAVFGLFAQQSRAAAAARRLRDRPWGVYLTRFVGHDEFAGVPAGEEGRPPEARRPKPEA